MYKLCFLSMVIASSICYAEESSSWNDYLQDSAQVKSPVAYISTYNKYSAIRPDLKIMLRDFGDINKTKKDIKYTLKKYGIQVLNGKDVYNVLRTAVPLQSNVDLALLYHDKDILAFRTRELSTVNYVKVPFKRNSVSAFCII